MKKRECAFQLETYTGLNTSGFIQWHKCWDIEGRRRVKRYNFILQIFKTTYWFSLRTWSSK